MAEIPFERTSGYAWDRFKATVAEIVSRVEGADIIEIGGGRSPLFSREDLPANVASYTINDISQSELDLAPSHWRKACFDICGDLGPARAQYDVVFSKMLAEHVPDGDKFHANVFRLLKSGGTAFHFMPTLYAPPFVLNKLLPETLSRGIVRRFFGNRHDEGEPKFPARYSMCYGRSERLIRRYRSIGYAEVDIQTFYGHGYFDRIPVVRGLDRALARFAYRHDLTFLGAYAYVRLAAPA
ncbi:MAG: class I SAM-dependent methyltransferase [Kiloniellaceae bacterium]